MSSFYNRILEELIMTLTEFVAALLQIVGIMALVNWVANCIACAMRRKLPYVKVTLLVNRETKNRLENMRVFSEQIGIDKVFNRALASYDLLIHASAEGKRIIFRSPDGCEQELNVN